MAAKLLFRVYSLHSWALTKQVCGCKKAANKVNCLSLTKLNKAVNVKLL